MLKRLFSIITISLILTGSFFSAYNIKYLVYADTTTDGWMNVTTNEQLADAFRYYCKSRDLTIDGSIADGVTKFTTATFNGLCKTLGIDMTSLQAKIKYQTDGNVGLRYLFDTEGISAYNRIFAQFLQDNDLEVGDSVNNKNLYSGSLFVTDTGESCLIYVVDYYSESNSLEVKRVNKSTIVSYGSQITDCSEVTSGTFKNYSYTINGNVYSGDLSSIGAYGNGLGVSCWTNGNVTYKSTYDNYWAFNRTDLPSIYGGITVVKTTAAIYIGTIGLNAGWNFADDTMYNFRGIRINANNNLTDNVNVYITTNNTVINNNNYEGDTIINNNGTTGDNDNPDNPDSPDIPDPNPGPTPDPPTIPDNGGWQDFSLPEMPNDWLIYGMEKKFPFDIPFNIMFALSLLNHEPEIPKFEGDLDLQVCTWHYDIDLTLFDDIATILRRFEVLAFIIGLAILTKELINWG